MIARLAIRVFTLVLALALSVAWGGINGLIFFVFCVAVIGVSTIREWRRIRSPQSTTLGGLARLAVGILLTALMVRHLWSDPDALLRSAAIGGYEGIARWSMKHGASPNGGLSAQIEPPLYLAAEHRHVGMIKTLVAAGAGTSRVNRTGIPVVAVAAQMGFTDVVDEPSKRGADLNQQSSKDGSTALMLAAESGKAETLRFLLAHNVPVDQRDRANRTALIYGATNPEVVQLLLAAHGNPDVAGNNGVTALMEAAARNVPGSVEILLKGGADRSKKNTDGMTALDVANRNGATKAADLLRQ